MKVYRGTDGDLAPVEMEASPDQARNTHFATEAEAWDSICRSVDAGLKLSARYVERAREELRKAEKNAADAVVEYRAVQENYRKWKESR